jgi:hypothetical protein
VPTPVGPLGPEEIDPNDPDLWDWDPDPESPSRAVWPLWIRFTALAVAGLLVVFVIAAFAH